MSASHTEQLAEDLRVLAEDAGKVFQNDEKKTADATRELRDHLAETLRSAEKTLASLHEKASEGVDATEAMIRNRPYKALGVAVAVGVVIGILAKRK